MRNDIPIIVGLPTSLIFSLLRGRKWHFASLILKRAFCLIGGANESVEIKLKVIIPKVVLKDPGTYF